MRAVNLLPRDLDAQRAEGGRIPLFVAGGGVVAVTVAAVMLVMGASGSVSDQRSQLESLEAAIAAVPSRGQPAVSQGAMVQERTDRVAALSAAISTRVPVDRLLRELAYVLPEDAWLTGLSAAAPAAGQAAAPPGSAPAAAATPGITIQGATYSHQSVARVLARLAALPTLTNVRLGASARVEPATPEDESASKRKTRRKKQRPVVTFSIIAGFRA